MKGAGPSSIPGNTTNLRPWASTSTTRAFPIIVKNYLEIEKGEIADKVSLAIRNPPSNIDAKTKNYIREHYGRWTFLLEAWLQNVIKLFGADVSIVKFTPNAFA